ncbi:DUF6073 family protein [Tropicibacter sp. S64]|uniref:DUF6073 family protein n=1 Tax=Tropicibacter sp. S64 TaxID=3415122 RepID=UPI003C7EBD8D
MIDDILDTDMKPLGKEAWGRVLSPVNKADLFKDSGAPARHVRGIHPPAGIDHMRLKTTDVFRIPGMGEFDVDFSGFFKVIRSDPSTEDWKTATVYVNFLELKLFGEHDQLGEISVDLNPNVVSAGNTFPGRRETVACRINVAARFHVERLGKTFFNKTPIQLMNEDVQGIPTIGEGGQAHVASLPLYDWERPNGELFGYVEELNYQVLDYARELEVETMREATKMSEFKALSAERGLRM